ncbi:MAG: hypothetical protein ACI8TL_000830 [Natronomonas sp.]|jgi:hypothetical protein
MSPDGPSLADRDTRDQRDVFGTPDLLRRPSATTLFLGVFGLAGVAVSFTTAVAEGGFSSLAATLGGTVLVASLLNHALADGRDLPPAVSESVYTAYASLAETVLDERDLSGQGVYLPSGGQSSARLVVPATGGDPLDRDWSTVDAVGDEHAVFTPTGESLYRAFRRMKLRSSEHRTDHQRLLSRLASALDSGFELVEAVSVTVEGDTATVSFESCVLPGVDRLDHPVGSFLAVGIAREFGEPVTVDRVRSDPDGSGSIELRWGPPS